MQLFWHGYSSIRIESKSADSEVSVVTDPYQNEASLRFPRTLEPDVLVLSHQDQKRFNIEGVGNAPFIVSDPGECEIKNVFIQGIQDREIEAGTKFRPVVYRIVVENIALAFLGQINRRLTDYELEELSNIDILLLPVGGGDVMSAKTAHETIKEVDPRIVVPLYFSLPGIKVELASVDAFCKELGVCKREDMNKLKLTKKDLPADEMSVMVLERV
ncbi:MAG: MBL fold metallo-hydrolase [Patescibacteria group bacterium]